MRTIKKKTPERHCFLEYDKLYVDHAIYVWNDILGQVPHEFRFAMNILSSFISRWLSSRNLKECWIR